MRPKRRVRRFVAANQATDQEEREMRIRIAWGVAVAAALAGCGGASGPSLNAFKDGFAAQRTSATQFGADLGRAIGTAPQKTNAEIATEFQQLSTRATREAAQLRRLDPPSKYEAQLGHLITGFGTVRTDLREISLAAAAGDVTRARNSTVKLLTDAAHTRTLDRALTATLGLRQS
jgi:hypothetical protein